jgi:hypothetical protein
MNGAGKVNCMRGKVGDGALIGDTIKHRVPNESMRNLIALALRRIP